MSTVTAPSLATKAARNGDLLVSVNGVALNGVDGAMGAVQGLRRVDSLAVELERKGERMIKTCDLR